MEFKKFGFSPPLDYIPNEVPTTEDFKKYETELTRFFRESSEQIICKELSLSNSDEVHNQVPQILDDLTQKLDSFTELILINASDENIVKAAIEDMKKEQPKAKVEYMILPYIPQGQIIYIQEEQLKHRLLNIKRENEVKERMKST